MEAFWLDGGYPALFALAFFAATLLPLGSEWLLVALLLRGADPLTAVAVASAGNTLGALTTYLIGRGGSDWLVRRALRIDAAARARAERHFRRYGLWALFCSWLPLIGDPLCLVAGVLRAPPLPAAAAIAAGKTARYAAVAWLALAAAT